MLNILPKFISMMFKKNNEIHNYNTRRGNSLHTWLQTTQPTSGGAVTADTRCCSNCVEPSRPQQCRDQSRSDNFKQTSLDV